MKYTIVDSAEFTYPDILSYATGSDKICLHSPRKSFASFQVVLSQLESAALSVDVGGLPFPVELYTLVPVQVERNHGLEPANFKPHFPERVAPYFLYDCLRPFDGTVELTQGVGGLYIAFEIPADAEPGEYEGTVTINGVAISCWLKIYAAVVPEETLTIINGYSTGTMCKYHGITAGTEEYDQLDRAYIKMLRRMHQNMLYLQRPVVKVVGENKYSFDFSGMEATMRRYFDMGIKYFNGPSVGWRQSWSASTILVNGNIPSMSYEGYCYLSQYLPALHEMLERNGWLDRFVMGVADEPNDANNTEFRALCGLIRKFVPDIRLVDAMSYGNLHGALDIWVPLNAEYDKHQKEIETLRANGDEIWHYVCCGPRGEEYINRFMDYPLLSTRYLFWGNYKYNLTGYLHWAANCYQPGQDPFLQNCPEHHNTDSVCYLPAGDTHIIYPGKNEPWMSIRLEAHRQSAEEFELLKALAAANKPQADEICARVFRSFRDVEYHIPTFNKARIALLEAVSAL